MSTRCQIGFYELDNNDLLKPNVLLYRHSDGYPGTVNGKKYGVLPDLVPILKLFNERRGLRDVMYAAAWTLHHLIDLHIKVMQEIVADHPDTHTPKDGKNMLGFGVCYEGFHGDIEYYYAIQGDTLRVYEMQGWKIGEERTLDDFKQIKRVSLKAPRKGN